MNSHRQYEAMFGPIGSRWQGRRFPSMQQEDSTTSMMSQQDVIMFDEEFARQEDHNRVIRRRRLLIRPLVVFVLGFFVFRNKNSYNDNSGSIRALFGSLFRSNESTSNTDHNNHGPGLRKTPSTEQELYGSSIHQRSNPGLRPLTFLYGGNPSDSTYAIVTDMNDCDSNDNIPSGIDQRLSPHKTMEGDHHHTDPVEQSRTSGTSGNDEAKEKRLGSNSKKNRNKNKNQIRNNGNIPSRGWVPGSYPDPWNDPVRCGIAFLAVEDLQQNQELHSSEAHEENLEAMAERERRGGLVVADTAASPVAAFHDPRLCDPDWVLGAASLERIAQKIREFSDRFDVSDIVQNRTPAPSPDQPEPPPQRIELAVATVRKMNVNGILRQEQLFFNYADDEDMVNDAAQIFARSLHTEWWRNRNQNNNNDITIINDDDDPLQERKEERRRNQQEDFREEFIYRSRRDRTPVNIDHNDKDFSILIFLSVQDRVCFISTGDAISTILPWWRLEDIVATMKPDLRHRDYGGAILTAIDNLSKNLEAGPPTLEDVLCDFVTRFGIVLGFALFTFFFGIWGECRDRRKRWQCAESRSQLNSVELEKARLKQREFKTKACPICLEPFTGEELECGYETAATANKLPTEAKRTCGMVRVDTYGIPLKGADAKDIKFLRCGHIFCESCWKAYVRSGFGNPNYCPVCRQDVGKSSSKKRRNKEQRRTDRRARREATSAVASVPSSAAPTEQMWLFGGESLALSDSTYVVPAYGSLNNSSDATRVLSSPTATEGNGDSNVSSGDDDNETLFDISMNLFASAFGPTRSDEIIDRDTNRHSSSNLSMRSSGAYEEWNLRDISMT